MSKEHNTKASIRNYVGDFIDKRDNELRAASGDEDAQSTSRLDRDSIEINIDDEEFARERLVNIIFFNIIFRMSAFFFFCRMNVHHH